MKRICYVVTISSTIKSFFLPQLNYLSQNGFDITVICSPDKALLKDLGNEIHFIAVNIPRGISTIGSLKAFLQLLIIFRREQFDLIQYSTPNASLCAAAAAKIANVKIRNYHLMGYRYLGETGVSKICLKWMEQLICSLSSHIECVSPSNLEFGVKERIFKSSKAVVVWNGSTGGVDLQRFAITKRSDWRKEIRDKLGYANNDFVFGFVGRITRDKGINELLEAFLKLSASAKLLIIGSEEGMDTLNHTLLEQAKCNENVCFHHFVDNIEQYYAALDILVLPSYREGFGNVVIEAAAMGTPAIVTNIPGPVNAIEKGKTGFIVEAKNADSLREAMQRCLAEKGELSETVCFEFTKTYFSSEDLCKRILERKQKLILGEYINV